MRPFRRPAISTAPWARAPLLLLTQPLAIVAIVAAAALLGLVVAAGPLYVSSVGTAALHNAAAKQCVQENRVSVVNPSLNPYGTIDAGPQNASDVAAADPVIRRAFAYEGLPSPTLTTYTAVPTGDTSGLRPTQVGLFATPGALDHVHVLSRVSADGVFLTDTYAAQLHLRAGDTLPLDGRGVRVAGIYRDLDTAGYRTVLPSFWCHWRDLIVKSVSSQPPPFALATPATVAALGTDIQAEWTSPTDIGHLTVAGARRVAAAGRHLSPAAGYAEHTSLDANLQVTGRLQDAVGTPVLSIAAAGAVLSLVLVAGAVLLWVQRRRPELALLSARGTGPAALALKAVLELGPAMAAGCALGWATGLALVPGLGPSGLTEPGAPGRALLAASGAWVAGLVAVHVVAALALGERRRRHHALGRWLPVAATLAMLGASTWLFSQADRRQVILPGVYRIDPALLLAPLLGLTGVVLAGALLATAPLLRIRKAAGRWSFPSFAALNRAAAARGALVVVVCGLAAPVGLAVYSAGFTDSTAATVTAKTQVYLGAPVALDLRVRLGELPNMGTSASQVSYALGQFVDGALNDGDEVELIGVDPRTLPRFAYEDTEVTGALLPDLLRQLSARSPDGAVPALLAGAGDGPAPAGVSVRSSVLPVTVVGRAPAFPGMRFPDRPAVVVDIAAVAGLDSFGNWHNELWTDQRHVGRVLATLGKRDILTDDVQQAGTFLDATDLLAVTWTFQFLRAVAVAVAAVSAGGLLLFLAARQQRQRAAYVLMRRMGMSRGAFRRSLLIELGTLAGWAWVSGTVTGAAALAVAARAIDVNPSFLPLTLLRLPIATVAVSAAALAVVVVGLMWLTQRRSESADPATVLRE